MKKILPKCFLLLLLVMSSFTLASQNLLAMEVSATDKVSSQKPVRVDLKDHLFWIEREIGVYFNYDDDLLSNISIEKEKLRKKLRKNELAEYLSTLLRPHDLGFELLSEDIYVIKPQKEIENKRAIKKRDFETQSAPISKKDKIRSDKDRLTKETLQQRTVSGKVVDDTGEGLPGASVYIKGTTRGVITDIDGNYRLEVEDDDEILVISYVGFLDQEVEIGDRTVIDITLKADLQALDEVVVTGYGNTPKSELIGSVATVKSKTLDKQPITTFEEALAGQVAGVNVRFNTGVPGGAPSINIRGISSISEEGIGNQPLFVVDGFIYGNTNDQFNNPLAGIAPGDIESITVLKDAASASLYGSRASGGVIIITTKSGRDGATRISFDSYVGLQVVPDIVKPQVLNARELAQFNREKWEDQYFADNGEFPTAEILATNNVVDPANYGEGTDWFDEITQDALMQNYNISASGGSKNVNYFISANYLDQQGTVIETGFKRYSIRANIDTKMGDKVKFGFRMTPSQAIFQRNGGTDPASATFSVLGTVLTSQWLGPDVRVRDRSGDLVPWEFSDLIVGRQVSPVYEQKVRENTQTTNQFNANTYLEYEPIKGLKIKPTFGVSIIANRVQGYAPPLPGDAFNPNLDPDRLAPATATFNYGESFRWQNENLITYSKTFNQAHNLDVLGAFTLQKSEGFGQATQTTNLLEPFKLPNSDNVSRVVPGTDIPAFNFTTFPTDAFNSQVSYIGRVKYNYKDRYFLTGAWRRDGSSRFGERVRFADFPSAAVGWRISNEQFFKNLGIDNIINNILIEGSYGQLGNNRIPDFRALGGVRLGGNSYVFGGQLSQGRAAGGGDVPNADLTWEETEEFAAGIDLGFLGNRIIFEADVYRRNIFNLLNNQSLPWVTGFTNVFGNIGDLRTEGLELMLRAVNIGKGKFRWDSDINVTFNETIVTRLGEDNFPIFREAVNGGNSHLFQIRVGDPLGLFYGLRYEGLYTEDDFDDAGNLLPGVPGYNGGGGAPVVGSAKFFDANGNGGIDISGDGVVIGDANPDFTFGFNNYFTYGPLSLKILMTGVVGQQVYDRTFELLNNFDPVNGREDLSTFNIHRNVLNRYRPGDDPHTKTVPGTAGGDRPWRWANSAHVKDAGYLAVRNITLTYDFVSTFRDQLDFLTSGSVYVSVQNAFIFSPFDGNPEAGRASAGALRPNVNFGSYPIARIFTGGIRLTL